MQKKIRARLDSLPKTEASFVEPMECLSVSKLPEGPNFLWEVKLEGYRALAVKSGNGVTLFSRRRKSLNRQFPYILEALADLPAGTVVDGEVVAVDESGRPDFNLLQHFRAESSRIQYYIFDLLCWKGRDLMRVPLVERRALLKSVVVILEKRIRIADYFEAAPNDLLALIRWHQALIADNVRRTEYRTFHGPHLTCAPMSVVGACGDCGFGTKRAAASGD